MSNPTYEKVEVNPPTTQNPPPYSDVQPYKAADPSAPPMETGTPLLMPPQYQTCYVTPGAGFNQGPVLQLPQTVLVSVAQPANEPDYLAYSIFTMLCCFLPLGIAALVYSVKTQNANSSGNNRAARKYSALARTLAHISLGLGVGFIVLYIILLAVRISPYHNNP